MKVFPQPIIFEWDKGNTEKNLIKHSISNQEAEEVFFDSDQKTFKDHLHSAGEERFRVIGKTKLGKLLFVVFTIRSQKVRIISVRNINRKEAKLYEKKTSTS